MSAKYWVGVVGLRDTWTRLLGDADLWWCMPASATAGDQVAMYLTRTVSAKHTGVFGLYQIERVDEGDSFRCKGFGNVGAPCNLLVWMSRVEMLQAPVPLAAMRKDPVLRSSSFIRRNAQGTAFALSKAQYERVSQTSIVTRV